LWLCLGLSAEHHKNLKFSHLGKYWATTGQFCFHGQSLALDWSQLIFRRPPYRSRRPSDEPHCADRQNCSCRDRRYPRRPSLRSGLGSWYILHYPPERRSQNWLFDWVDRRLPPVRSRRRWYLKYCSPGKSGRCCSYQTDLPPYFVQKSYCVH